MIAFVLIKYVTQLILIINSEMHQILNNVFNNVIRIKNII